MGSIIWDLPFSLMLGLKFMSNLIHTPTAEDFWFYSLFLIAENKIKTYWLLITFLNALDFKIIC
ncbi:hypothetical protein BH18THE1_BH18THE1_17490 [soil metagenome]